VKPALLAAADGGGVTLTDWLPSAVAVVPVVVGGVIQWWLQRREFDNRATEWHEQQSAERGRWKQQRHEDRRRGQNQLDAEHNRFLLSERRHIYADVIAAMRQVGMAGQRLANEVSRDRHQPDTLARWEDVLTNYARANEQAMLLGSVEFVEAARTTAMTAWGVPFPMDEPSIWQEGADGKASTGLMTWVRSSRPMREPARREFGLPDLPDPPAPDVGH
jgi:hypothetical protein